MRRFLRDHSLSIVTLGAFLVIWLVGQGWSGHRTYNEEQRADGQPTVGMAEYVTRAHFGEATFENWESEFPRSLSTALLGLFVLAFVGHLVTGAHAYSAEQAAHHQTGGE